MLSQFKWSQDDMGEVMIDIQDGVKPKDAALKYVKNIKTK